MFHSVLVVLRQSGAFVSSLGPRVLESASQRIFSYHAQDQAALQRTSLKVPVVKVVSIPPPRPTRLSGNYFRNKEDDDTTSSHQQVVQTSYFKPCRRHFSAIITSLQPSGRSFFPEDYDEWYSHGKVAPRKRPGDHPVYDCHECHDTEPGRKSSCFLLEELEREELQLHLFQDEQHDDLDDPFFEFDTPEKAVAGKDAVDLYKIVEDQMCGDDE
jgi:hypothetical protein